MSKKFGRTGIAMLALLHLSLAGASDEAKLPPDSIYNLQVPVEDQSAEITGLDRYRGQPVLVTMFYASCPHVCPMIISTIRQLESRLSPEELSGLRVLTISIDPERDTPELLLETLQRHSVDADRWSMVRPEPGDVRMITGVLGVKYKQLPDGEFSHTTRIILLDRDGVQIASSDTIGRHDAAFLESVKTSLR
jgi:protein SCO1/2